MRVAKIGMYLGWFIVGIGGLAQPFPNAFIVSALGYSLGMVMLLVSGYGYAIVALKRGNSFPIKIAIGLTVFFLGFPIAVAAIATSGQIGFVNAYGTGWQFLVFIQLKATLVQSVVVLVGVCPYYLHKRLAWDAASDRAKILLPSWIAALASIATGGQIMLLHYYYGPLSNTGIGTVVVAALLASALLAPVYKWLAKTIWISGFSSTFSPRRWFATISEVLREIPTESPDQAALESSQDKVGLSAICRCPICVFHRLRCTTCREYVRQLKAGIGTPTYGPTR